MKGLIIAKNTFYQATARLATSSIGFLITIVLANKFGAETFGDFTKVISYVAMFYLAVDLGLNAIFLQNEKIKFREFLYLRLVLALGTILVLNLISISLPYNSLEGLGFSDQVKLGIFIFSFSVFFQGIILSSSAVFQKKLNYLSYAIGIIAGAIINLGVTLVFAFLNFSIFYILLSFILSNFVTAAILIYLTKEKLFPIAFSFVEGKELIIKAMPIGLMLAFNLIYFRADIFILSFLKPAKDVGIYGLSYRFFDFLIALPLFLSNAVYPFLLKEKESPLFGKYVKKYFLIFLTFSFAVMIPFWFISPLFSLIKTDFIASAYPFRILLLSLPFFFTTSFLQWVLITLGKQGFLMKVYLASTVFNILLNILLIPSFSYIASAVITVLSEALVLAALFLKVFPFKNLFEREGESYG